MQTLATAVLDSQTIIQGAILILLPIIPAIALFKIFPDSKATVEGTFWKSKWKATGGFAGYILVLYILYRFFDARDPNHDAWTVKGEIQLVNSEETVIATNSHPISVIFNPPTVNLANGTFSIKLSRIDGNWPTLVLDAKDFGLRNIDLGVDETMRQFKADENSHTFTAMKPIVIKEIKER